MSSPADATLIALTAGMVALLASAVIVSARRAGWKDALGKRLALWLCLLLAAWLTLTAGLAASRVLAASHAQPPFWPLLPMAAFVVIALLVRRPGVQTLLAHTPRVWPIAAQSFRVGVELALFSLHAEDRAPLQITFAGRNFDILVGLTAPLIAWLIARGRLGARGATVWNVLGLAVLANTVATVATSAPGPLHGHWPGVPLTAIAEWPVVWLPAFLMPLAVFLHVVSIRQHSKPHFFKPLSGTPGSLP